MFEKLKKAMSSSEDFDDEYLEIDLGKEEKENKVLVKLFVMKSYEDVNEILNALRQGYTIAVIDIKTLRQKDSIELKRAVSKIKKTNFPLKTDVNNRISWTEDEEISREFVWKNVEEYDFHGIKILVPNPDLDVLIRLAHLPFEQAEIRLGELLHIYRQAKTVNWERLQKEAERNHWLKTFERVRLLLNKLHDGMFNKQRPIRFPYRLSFFLLVQAIIEKKAWRKIWGARYVIKNRLSS